MEMKSFRTAAKEPLKRTPDTSVLLPTQVPRRRTYDNVLHAKYLSGLRDHDKPLNNPSYRGDIYEDVPSDAARKWEKEPETQGEYMKRLRASAKAFPEAKYLTNWMEVSTLLSRHTHLSENPPYRTERAERIHVTRIDFRYGHEPLPNEIKNKTALETALKTTDMCKDKPAAQVFVVEDLSRDMIELFGSRFNIDPVFFRSHVNDYMWNSITGESSEPKDLNLLRRHRSHFMMQYLRPRYYRRTSIFYEATREAGNFNVLRHLDSDRSREFLMDEEGAGVCLMRAKLSMWIQEPTVDTPFPIGILLVDPTPKFGHALWGGYTSLAKWDPAREAKDLPAPPRTSLNDDVIFWLGQIRDDGLKEIVSDPKALAAPAIKLMLCDWHHVVQYITTQTGQVDWIIDIPDLRAAFKHLEIGVMRKLHPWKRNMFLYRAMVTDAMHQLFADNTSNMAATNAGDCNVKALHSDFQIILNNIDALQNRIEQVLSYYTSWQSMLDSSQAIRQNNSLAKLTYLATIFIPLSFVSGFLSMVPDVSQLKQTIWIFFAIAVPMTSMALFVADFLSLRSKSKRILKFLFKRKKTD